MLNNLLLSLFYLFPNPPTEVGEYTLPLRPLFPDISFAQPGNLRPAGQHFLLVESGNHRIIRLDQNGRVVFQLGEIGSTPRDLLNPEKVLGLPDGGYLVLDHSIYPVKRFGADGTYQKSLSFGKSLDDRSDNLSITVAVDDQEHIYLNQPRKNTLISVYNFQGKRLRGFGQKVGAKKVFPDLYADHQHVRRREYSESLNRVILQSDGEGGLFACFIHAPILRHYDREGQLTFEIRFEGPEVDHFLKEQLMDPGAFKNSSYNFNGLQMLVLTNDMSWDAESRRVFLLVGGRTLYVFSKDGQFQSRLPLDHGGYVFSSLEMEDGRGWLASWSRLFTCDIPPAKPQH